MPTADASTYAGPLIVTIAYVALYYAFMLHIMRTKSRLRREYEERGEKFDRYFGNDREMLAADRIQLNVLEHMPPFLVLLWLNAVFVDTTFATIVGVVYFVARATYPFLMGRRLGRGVRVRILIATFTGYLALVVYLGGLVWRLVV